MEDENNDEISRVKFKYAIYCIFMLVIVALGSSAITYKYIETGINTQLKNAKEVDIENSTPEESTEKIAKVLKVFRESIDKYYIGEVNENDLLEGTIKGYIQGLGDEYSEYMTKDEWADYQADALGNYVGVGIYMSQDKLGNIVVLAPIKDSPADAAGVQSGDIISTINDESTVGMSSTDAASKVKGDPGTNVKLGLLRNNENIEVELERQKIKIYHVDNEMLDDEIGYIRLLTFDDNCSEEVKKAYEELKNKGAKKIVLDLRNNTGGLVDEALKIADFMIEKNKDVLITVDSNDNRMINKSNNDPIMDCPIVVLVNEYTASASEILTGALKDNNEAVIIGTTTYGKGVIQNVFQLTDGSALKLTVAEYFTPNEVKINKVGIKPDVEVEDVKQENEEEIDEQLNKAIEIIKDMQ